MACLLRTPFRRLGHGAITVHLRSRGQTRPPASVHDTPVNSAGSWTRQRCGAGALLCITLILAPGGLDAQAGDVDILVDQVLAAHGGTERLAQVRGYRLEGTMRAHVRGEDAALMRFVGPGDRLEVLIHYARTVELRVLEGGRGWRGSSQQDLVPVRGPLLSAMVLQAVRANLPWILDRRRGDARAAVLDTGNGTSLEGLEIPVGEGLVFRAFLDPRTKRVVRSQSIIEAGPARIVFETVYSDFRSVEGILFAFHEENFASGSHTATTTVDRIVVNPDEHRAELSLSP